MGARALLGCLRRACLLGLPALLGCALLFPPRFERTSQLLPQPGQQTAEYAAADGRVTYAAEGVRIEVVPVSDRQLNETYGDEAEHSQYSANPFTYGSDVDPALGYVASRFTVFRVTVHNLSSTKVELRPLRCVLVTDRPGEELEAYGVQAGSARKALEAYLKALRGATGNGEYLYTMRMATVHSSVYPSGEPVQRGETREGLVVFDPLDDAVHSVTLRVRDFVLRFNAYDKPLQTLDLAFRFDRTIAVEARGARVVAARLAERTRGLLRSPSQVTGQLAGDLTRETGTIDAFVRTRQDELNRCFSRAFAAGTATPGSVSLRYVILAHGGVESADVTSSSIGSREVGQCMAERVRQWHFPPSAGVGAAPAAADSAAAPAPAQPQSTSGPVVVVSTVEFSEAAGER